MATQLKGTLTLINHTFSPTCVFKSEDGATTYTFESRNMIVETPVDLDNIETVLNAVKPDLLTGYPNFHCVVSPTGVRITMEDDQVVIMAQLSKAIDPPFTIINTGVWPWKTRN